MYCMCQLALQHTLTYWPATNTVKLIRKFSLWPLKTSVKTKKNYKKWKKKKKREIKGERRKGSNNTAMHAPVLQSFPNALLQKCKKKLNPVSTKWYIQTNYCTDALYITFYTCMPRQVTIVRWRCDKVAPFICKIPSQPLNQLHSSVHQTSKESAWVVCTFTELEKGCKWHFL